ncbi:HAD family hydrolase [Tepidibacillus fermentans]|uniref:HAD superfamily hydrolase (TIGR01549 family) n=1 Tax=Tepidibacillus fermentans TaxID=1281767 RepID=A0A4R3KER4_9BACI|nr:HAD-IA family hydrolase [Tepidibacillus fermentans]TCS81585.1 HAD superfamily hydrolase (TIGR01549 family) [Tepidibacillus fermentans]
MAGIRAIIFDFDGTLFQTEQLAIPSFIKTFEQLKKDGYFIPILPSKQKMLGVIGMTLEKIWKELLPNLSKEAHEKANRYMLENELKGVKNGLGSLYPKVKETLKVLKESGYLLFIASNGLEFYVKNLANTFDIDHLFAQIYTAGEHQTKSKVDLVAKILKDYGIERAVMVGDRSSDIEAGKVNNLPTIGCDFGFADDHELIGADIKIQSFDQLPHAIHQIL